MRAVTIDMRRSRFKHSKASIAVLASEIRMLRSRLNLNQEQFAAKVGVSQQTVSDWEKGKRLRQLQVAIDLVRLLGLPMNRGAR